jgi:hypothetical protein
MFEKILTQIVLMVLREIIAMIIPAIWEWWRFIVSMIS